MTKVTVWFELWQSERRYTIFVIFIFYLLALSGESHLMKSSLDIKQNKVSLHCMYKTNGSCGWIPRPKGMMLCDINSGLRWPTK